MDLVIIGEHYTDRVELSRKYGLNNKQVNVLCDKIDYFELTDTDLSRISNIVGVKQFLEGETHLVESLGYSPTNRRLLTRSKFLELQNGSTIAIL